MEGDELRRYVVVLAATSMVLITISLLQPWFIIEHTVTVEDGGYTHSDEYGIRLYPRHYTFDDGAPGGSGDPIWEAMSYQEDSAVSDTLGFVNSALLLCLVLVWLLVVAAVLNLRTPMLVLSWISAGTSLFCIAVFSGGVPDAVRDSSETLQNWPTGVIAGLFGKESYYSEVLYPHTDTWAWQPGWGWLIAFLSALILCVTIVLSFRSVFPRTTDVAMFDDLEGKTASGSEALSDDTKSSAPVEKTEDQGG